MDSLTAREWLVLRDCPLFTGLDETSLGTALRLLRGVRRDVEKGTLCHRAGEPMPTFGLVLSGSIQVVMEDMEGNQVLMAQVGPGQTFGESLAYLRSEDAPISVLAAENGAVLWLNPACLFTPGADPVADRLIGRFTAMLAHRTLDMNSRIQILTKVLLRDRLTTFFAQCLHEYGSRTFTLPFDRSGMAQYLGVNRSALSRELAAMKDEGLIDFYKNVFRIL